VKAYYDEGPGGGHYDILMDNADVCLSCGWNTNDPTRSEANTPHKMLPSYE